MLEEQLLRIADALERIAVSLESRNSTAQVPTEAPAKSKVTKATKPKDPEPPPVPEVVKEPEPEPEPAAPSNVTPLRPAASAAEAPKAISYADVQAAARRMSEVAERDEIVAVLDALGVAKLNMLVEDQYADAIAAFDQAVKLKAAK